MQYEKMDRLLSYFTTAKSWVDKILSLTLIGIVGAMTLLVTYQVVVRYLFNSPSAISEVMSRYLFIWLILFGSAYVFGLREHMAITFIKDKFNEKLKTIVEMFIELVTVFFAFSIMIIGGYNSAVRQMWQLDSALQVPMGVIYSAIPIAGGLIAFYFLYNEFKLINKLLHLNSASSNS
ncbi:C4-dicarboxylate ABC transporter permease [Vibrio sp. 10N.286.49.C2]|uniref:TRAP transporter small permease n=1 Tax=unclassified Vibrio TaxID=2614977 RepID=UPI000CBFA76B|nr:MULTISPECIES: TRAP transporter small permease [unclassified Vibrio]PMH33809.1 C4-dicarboxylate ABC transporter permease [Vibrio sp. 10N.286.49.C2]PMH44066.1 C4-dicarboxylate ABC transporter permease [Vibrio sp. 10N.286.49.B1]PMH82970.1 C4-dicarboxylate ABC transporter permease [Vibrio sp. 10N.286.48.B7]